MQAFGINYQPLQSMVCPLLKHQTVWGFFDGECFLLCVFCFVFLVDSCFRLVFSFRVLFLKKMFLFFGIKLFFTYT